MTDGVDDSDLWDELLADGIRFAWRVAADSWRGSDGPQIPAPLVPLVRFRKLPATAVSVIRQVLADDDEFRAHVAGRPGVERLSRASMLFIARPDGWADELDSLAESVVAAEADAKEARASERVIELERRLAVARDAEIAAAADARRRDEEREELAAVNRDLSARIADLESEAQELTAGRRRAVRELKAAEKRLAERTAELRETSEALASLESESVGGEPSERGTGGVVVTEDDGERLAAHLAAVDDILRRTGVIGDPATEPGAHGEGDSGPRGRQHGSADRTVLRGAGADRPSTRLPPTMAAGLVADTSRGVEWLARRPGAVILVDGYNVAIASWGHLDIALQRDRLMSTAEGLAARSGVEIHVVFDGADDTATGARRAGSRVRCEFTPAHVEADDRILEMIDQIPSRRIVVVVSDDRRVRKGAEVRGAVAVGVTAFVAASS